MSNSTIATKIKNSQITLDLQESEKLFLELTEKAKMDEYVIVTSDIVRVDVLDLFCEKFISGYTFVEDPSSDTVVAVYNPLHIGYFEQHVDSKTGKHWLGVWPNFWFLSVDFYDETQQFLDTLVVIGIDQQTYKDHVQYKGRQQ